MFNLKGRVAVVTGASSGLGKQMAIALAKQGANVAVLARRIGRLESLAKDLEVMGVTALPVQCDIMDVESIKAAKEKVMEKFGKVDILINNAGSTATSPIQEMEDDVWSHVIELDLTGVFRVTKEFVKPMIDAKYGRIINIASMHGMTGTNQNNSAYHSAKAGVINFTRAAAAEFAPYGITCNSISPGFFKTELLTGETLEDEGFKQYMTITVPLGRPGTEVELNPGAIFLASDEASYVTGVNLPIDGGWSNTK